MFIRDRSIYAKSFNWSGFFLPKKIYYKCSVLYDFCRTLDNIADQNKDLEIKKKELEQFRNKFEQKNQEDRVIKNMWDLMDERNISKKIVYCSLKEAEFSKLIENIYRSVNISMVNEMKMIGLSEEVKEGTSISVLLERIEDKNGEVVVSASKAQKIKGWDILVKAFENNEPIMGKITSKCKGGVIVEHLDTGSLMFCPGSQISDILSLGIPFPLDSCLSTYFPPPPPLAISIFSLSFSIKDMLCSFLDAKSSPDLSTLVGSLSM